MVGRPRPGRRREPFSSWRADDVTLDPLVALASQLAAHGGHELVIAALVHDAGQLAERTARLNGVRAAAAHRGVAARVAAFTSADAAPTPGGWPARRTWR